MSPRPRIANGITWGTAIGNVHTAASVTEAVDVLAQKEGLRLPGFGGAAGSGSDAIDVWPSQPITAAA